MPRDNFFLRFISLALLAIFLCGSVLTPLDARASISPQEKRVLLTGALTVGAQAALGTFGCYVPEAGAVGTGLLLGGIVGFIGGALGGDETARMIGTAIGATTGGIVAYLAATRALATAPTGLPVTAKDVVAELDPQRAANVGNCVKENVVKPLNTIMAKVLLRTMTAQIVAWIQDERNSGFVDNLARHTGRVADEAGGQFLTSLAGINLCSNLYAYLNVTLQTPPVYQRFKCGVSDIVRNVDDFYRNWGRGGWAAFLRINIQPQNNPYGAFLLALDTKLQKESTAIDVTKSLFGAGRGFLGFNVRTRGDCEVAREGTREDIQPLLGQIAVLLTQMQNLDAQIAEQLRLARESGSQADSILASQAIVRLNARKGELQQQIDKLQVEIDKQQEKLGAQIVKAGAGGKKIEIAENTDGEKNLICEYTEETKTPGDVIATGLNKSIWAGIDTAAVKEEVNTAIAAIIQASVGQIIKSSTFVAQGGGGGVYSGGTGSIRGTTIGPDGKIQYENVQPYGGQLSGQGIFAQPPPEDTRDSQRAFADASRALAAATIGRPIAESYAILKETDAKLAALQKSLFEKHAHIDAILALDASARQQKAPELALLRQDTARIQALARERIQLKRDILQSQNTLLGTLANLAAAQTAGIETVVATSTAPWSDLLRRAADEERLRAESGVAAADILDLATPLTHIFPVTGVRELTILVAGEERSATERTLALLSGTAGEMERIFSNQITEVCEAGAAPQPCFNRTPAKERLTKEQSVIFAEEQLLKTDAAELGRIESLVKNTQTFDAGTRALMQATSSANRDKTTFTNHLLTIDGIMQPIYQ